MAGTTAESADTKAIRPFRVEIPEAEIEGLRARIAATRWPETETVADQSQGVQLATIQALARYWATDYDFRRFEARLNAFNMPGTVPLDVSKALTSNVFGTGDSRPADLSADESRAYEQLSFLFTKGIGYALEMGLRPQTLYGLADSPIALAAWMLDHDARSYDDISQAFVDGDPVGRLTRNEILDNITLAWVTNTGISSARLYWENALGFFDVKGVTVPAAVSVFPRELYQAPRRWAEKAYPTSSTSTRLTRATTSLPGRNGDLHHPRCGRRSGRCVDREERACLI
jgi:hypothetical protein